MDFPTKKIVLNDGRTCVLRPAKPDDAAALIHYLKVTAEETPYLLRYPDEVDFSLEKERQILSDVFNDPGAVMMVAEVDGRIAGNSGINGAGNKRKIRHRCILGVALYREFHRLGIGTAMLEYLTALARQIGYEQIDLEVFSDNAAGQALYKKCGFTESGRLHNAIRFEDGSYQDCILMYLPLKDG